MVRINFPSSVPDCRVIASGSNVSRPRSGTTPSRDWNLDVNRECRHGFAAIHFDLHLIGLKRDMSSDYCNYLLAQNAKQIRVAARDALMRKEDLQAFARYRRGTASKEMEQAHAAFRAKSVLKMPLLSLGTTMATCSPLSRRAASK